MDDTPDDTTTPPEPDDGLNPRQRKFAAEYVMDHNATAAAKRAGYSEATAHAQGWRLLKHVAVRAEIERREKAVMDDLGITTWRLLAEIKKIATTSEKDGDRLRALDMLGKRLGWADRIEVTGDVVFSLDIPRPGTLNEEDNADG